jgi:hypothetical protein
LIIWGFSYGHNVSQFASDGLYEAVDRTAQEPESA